MKAPCHAGFEDSGGDSASYAVEEQGASTSPDIELSVLIVSWNTKALLRRCIQTVRRATKLVAGTTEIIVVDNASTDGSVEMIEADNEDVRLIASNENVGFGRANNRGLHNARGRLVMLLNPDTELGPLSLSQILSFMAQNPHVGVAAPRLVNPDGSMQTSCYPTPTLVREFWRMFHLDKVHPFGAYPQSTWSLDLPRDVDSVQGACLVVRREALEQVGDFDENYFMYTEEIDLCYRILRAGWRITWVPWVNVIHHGGQSTAQVHESMFRELYSSKIKFFRKHYGGASAVGYKLILAMASSVRILLAPLGFLDQRNRAQRNALVRNYSRLLRALPSL